MLHTSCCLDHLPCFDNINEAEKHVFQFIVDVHAESSGLHNLHSLDKTGAKDALEMIN